MKTIERLVYYFTMTAIAFAVTILIAAGQAGNNAATWAAISLAVAAGLITIQEYER